MSRYTRTACLVSLNDSLLRHLRNMFLVPALSYVGRETLHGGLSPVQAVVPTPTNRSHWSALPYKKQNQFHSRTVPQKRRINIMTCVYSLDSGLAQITVPPLAS
jgi:hypothetical protein